ncbi:DNA protection during starvation protein 1 [Thalassovita gelatinovora]|uniref:DNA protection during starvation protein 1 n=1 Tax=Thalassovita gelatinovora TaxID=53501 RepID=A0A0P1FHC1_THAGE|nr:DNA starvation/stationary phase protection protein [Thalassovita gelatinovora]QIZ81879.1 DNA starvation/stationary phase protection protein [Thalassovita gelatinovora]CUH67206.1 DNA protection during starvation protein 1 [Thalassovita gelatinovora]SEP78430.1 starvation-inducible DNA-binding protein [Thalassovita gelatinovora]
MKSTPQANIDALNTVLSQTFRLYVQTHGYHWNVEGHNFRQLHEVFEAQYQNLWGALDEIAERLRIQGTYAPGTVADLMSKAGPEDAPAQSAEEMVAKLIAGHDALADTLRGAITTAGEAGDEVSVGLLTDRLEWHEKELWMMKAGTR